MRKKGMIWFTLILLLASLIPNLMQAYIVNAQSSDEVRETIVDTSNLKVSTVVKQVDNKLNWEVKYQLAASDTNKKERLKFKFFNGDANSDANLVLPEEVTDWGYNTDNWFMPEAFAASSEGSILVVTDLSVEKLNLRLQMDEEVTHEVEVETTVATEQGVEGEESEEAIAQTETITEIVEETVIIENVLETPHSDTHQLSAPKVTIDVEENKPNVVDKAEGQEEETSDPSEEESSPSENDSEDEEEIYEIQNFQYDMGIMPFAVGPYNDPFKYTPDGGKYPTHGTNNYNATQTNNNIKNYDYASTADAVSGVPVKNILSGSLNFEKGYHKYDVGTAANEEIYTKKIAMPTDDPTKFKIQLDIIGGYLQTRRNVDVVFVVDKSGSMEGSNWTSLKNALSTFANGLLGGTNNADGAIRLGLASFGGAEVRSGRNTTWTAFGEIGNFGGSQGNYTGFTSNASTFLNHNILSVTPTGGTPTFLGLDAGLELLTNTAYNARSNAEKILVILTDGAPTYRPTNSYTGIRQTGSSANSRMTRSTPSSTVERFTAGSNLFTGDGSSTPIETRTAIVNHANNRSASYPNIDRYSIGFNVSNVEDILLALGPKGQYSATSQSQLTTVMDAIRNKILDTSAFIHDANVFDPMSPYVTLDTNSVKPFALSLVKSPRSLNTIAPTSSNYPSYASDVVINKTGNQINLSNLTLSGDANKLNGFRIEYEVTLKEEYRDGKFYPTNGPTYLADDHYTDPFGFAVPSVKHQGQTFSIPVEKKWVDDNNHWDTRQNITLKLQKQVGTNWIDVSGESVSIAKTATGNGLKHTFANLQTHTGGQLINYRVVEVPDRVPGYEIAVYSQGSVNSNSSNKAITVTNTLVKAPAELWKFHKVNESDDPLQGVKFQLFEADGTTPIGSVATSNAQGAVSLGAGLPVGHYFLRETYTLDGYQEVLNDWPIEVKDMADAGHEPELMVLGLDDLPDEEHTGNQIVNKLKPFELKVIKQDNNGNALEGAEFTLTPVTDGMAASISGNTFIFTGLKPGTYTLTETKTPSGYIGIDPITIIIDSKGKVTIDGVTHTVDSTGEHNLIMLTVKNRAAGVLPTTGGHGTQQYVVATIILASLMGVVGIYYVYRNRKGAE